MSGEEEISEDGNDYAPHYQTSQDMRRNRHQNPNQQFHHDGMSDYINKNVSNLPIQYTKKEHKNHSSFKNESFVETEYR